jgi:DNA-binding NarL/FixJ family response regulator
VADDDDRFREELESALLAYGWIDVVGSARNGYEAAQLFEELSPDMAIVDVIMPRCDGIEATRLILEHDAGAHVIAISAASDRVLAELVVAVGARAFVVKDADGLAVAPLVVACLAGASYSRNSPRATMMAAPPTSTASSSSADPSARA